MTYLEYMQECVDYLKYHADMRWGQACFNVLEVTRPDIADMVRNTKYDPYHVACGGDIRPFWRTVRAAW